jgi:hypothetical protein
MGMIWRTGGRIKTHLEEGYRVSCLHEDEIVIGKSESVVISDWAAKSASATVYLASSGSSNRQEIFPLFFQNDILRIILLSCVLRQNGCRDG